MASIDKAVTEEETVNHAHTEEHESRGTRPDAYIALPRILNTCSES